MVPLMRVRPTIAHVLLASALLAAGCSSPDSESVIDTPPTTDLLGLGPPPAVPALDPTAVAEGEVLYRQYCASCHGADLAGDPDWMTPNEDGSFRPPPHDSSGHTWHHPDPLLIEIVRDGGGFPESRMPGFGERLSDEQVESVLAYLKSSWGPEERAHQWRMTWQDRQLGS